MFCLDVIGWKNVDVIDQKIVLFEHFEFLTARNMVIFKVLSGLLTIHNKFSQDNLDFVVDFGHSGPGTSQGGGPSV